MISLDNLLLLIRLDKERDKYKNKKKDNIKTDDLIFIYSFHLYIFHIVFQKQLLKVIKKSILS